MTLGYFLGLYAGFFLYMAQPTCCPRPTAMGTAMAKTAEAGGVRR
jgi:hypothetical protein